MGSKESRRCLSAGTGESINRIGFSEGPKRVGEGDDVGIAKLHTVEA